jgi:hypothetical protein
MDNTRDLPGYKYYVDPETGERPAVYVAYLDLAPDPASTTRGVLFQRDDLPPLDERERNYERADVTDGIDPPPTGRVWAYIGTPAARERFERGNAVVSRAYLQGVRQGLAQIGVAPPDPPVPVLALERVDL